MKRHLIMILSIALVAGLLLAGCSSQTTSTTPATSTTPVTTTSAVTGPAQILIGAVVPLTGQAASFGQGTFGLKAAVDDLNAQGGIMVKEFNRKIPVKITVLDSQSDTTKIGTLAQSLILNDKVNFLVTSPSWPQDIAATANVAEKNKTPFIAFAGPFEPNNGVREAAGGWKYTWETGFAIGAPPPPGDFRTGLAGYTNMDLWMSYLNQFGAQTNKKVAVFASDDPDGRGWYAAFTPALKGAGFNPMADKELGIAPNETNDFSPMIKQWMDGGAELLMGNAPAPFVGTLLRQCSSLGFKPKVIIAEKAGMLYDDVMSWGGNLPNGVMALIEWSPAVKNAKGIGSITPQNLNDRWTAANNGKPFQPMVGCGYSQVQILADAIERAGTLDKDKVNAALATTDMVSMRGRVKYDATQFSRMPIAYGQWVKAPDPIKWQMKIIFAGADFTVEAQPMFPIPY